MNRPHRIEQLRMGCGERLAARDDVAGVRTPADVPTNTPRTSADDKLQRRPQ